MALGLTKSEQAALVAVTAVILGGMFAREWTSPDKNSGIWIEEQKGWSPLALDAADGSTGTPRGSDQKSAAVSPQQASASEARGAAPDSRGAQSTSDSPAAIDLNLASPADLERLPGIGPVRARAIIAFRDTHGGFSSIQEVTQVSGIGEKTLKRIEPYLRLTPPEVPRPAASGSAPGRTAALGSQTDPTVEGAPESRAEEHASGLPALESAAASEPVPHKININRADAKQLESIPGIGPVLSRRIIARRRVRPFARPEDLIDIQGIGAKNLEKMRPWITTDP